MDRKILITYASKSGTTQKVAAQMAQTLKQYSCAVDVLPVSQAKDLSPYTTVILGSAIRMGKVLPEVQAFVEKNQAILQQKTFHAFVTCMTLSTVTEENQRTANAFLEPIRALVKPASEGLFAGEVNPNKLGLFERLIMKMVKSPVGDFVNWEQINTWTEQVIQQKQAVLQG